jgi:hypothetical protein
MSIILLRVGADSSNIYVFAQRGGLSAELIGTPDELIGTFFSNHGLSANLLPFALAQRIFRCVRALAIRGSPCGSHLCGAITG